MTSKIGLWKLVFFVVVVLAVGTSEVAAAKTLCVNTGGTKGCYSTINAAVAAAAAHDTITVAAGTYKEDVVIGKSLYLMGAGSATTIVDATGQNNAFYVDGLDNKGLYEVLIEGFTAENANFEGILVTNASDVTIWGNLVTKNDAALDFKTETCPGLPAFETSEGLDCGEGIHLSGATYSQVVNNVSEGNAGGMLLSDDTGILTHNLIAGNTVKDNIYDCGITIPSHPPYPSTAPKPYGITYNTISGNTVTGNGQTGIGAGVGLFEFATGTIVAGNVVINNTLTHNGIPGVTFHSHAAGLNMMNNQIVGNTIAYNGADVGGTATPGPAGINVFGVSPVSGTVIAQNSFSHEAYDIVTNTPAGVTAHFNNLGGKVVGVDNIGAGSVDATENYWGCTAGPKNAACSSIAGPKVTYTPWLTAPF